MLSMDWMPTWAIHLATEAISDLEGADLEGANLEEIEASSDLIGAILNSNLLNIIIILALLIYLGRKVIGETLSTRRNAIIQDLESAEKRQQTAMAALADQQQKLAQAQQEAERIKQQANVNAEKLRAELIAQADADAERLKANAAKEVAAEQDRVMAELRRRIVQQALAKAEADIPAHLDDQLQHRLVDNSVQLIKG
ncbi:MAG: F0F1 ATP synthase subunit B [Synechococcaceae cyanobacterium SM2_3_2]|nr:F0F1 ATP synthase subunit B [Synechococcaceae cyanobacterium SM2_3_2]